MKRTSGDRTIGYVSIPFGVKHDTDFTKIYTEGIAATFESLAPSDRKQVFLFREDERVPKLGVRHRRRLEQMGYSTHPVETRLREEIQKHIVLADFIVADISHANANVMLEVGFSQAIGKRIIYLTHTIECNPTNLGDLKRFFVYQEGDLDHLRINLSLKINEVVSEVREEARENLDQGGDIEYFPERQKIPLDELLESAQSTIQILTTNLTTVSANYRESIMKAIQKAEEEDRTLEVTILTSDPTNLFIKARAEQLDEDFAGYQSELEGSLKSVAVKLLDKMHCKILTYRDFPVQLWHRMRQSTLAHHRFSAAPGKIACLPCPLTCPASGRRSLIISMSFRNAPHRIRSRYHQTAVVTKSRRPTRASTRRTTPSPAGDAELGGRTKIGAHVEIRRSSIEGHRVPRSGP